MSTVGYQQHIGIAVERLRGEGVRFDGGLSDHEVKALQQRFGIRFPPDMRFFLQTAVPVSSAFPNWRGDADALRQGFVDRPDEGVLFDVEHADFWRVGWGRRPDIMSDAVRVARSKLAALPRLIPICDGQYLKCMASDPSRLGTPVFSVRQTDVVHCGRDLASFLNWLAEEDPPDPPVFSEDYLDVLFWTE